MNPIRSVDEYMSPELFPLTTQVGLNPEQQMLIDAHNYDEFLEANRGGALLTPEEDAIGAELGRKAEFRASLLQAQGVK